MKGLSVWYKLSGVISAAIIVVIMVLFTGLSVAVFKDEGPGWLTGIVLVPTSTTADVEASILTQVSLGILSCFVTSAVVSAAIAIIWQILTVLAWRVTRPADFVELRKRWWIALALCTVVSAIFASVEIYSVQSSLAGLTWLALSCAAAVLSTAIVFWAAIAISVHRHLKPVVPFSIGWLTLG